MVEWKKHKITDEDWRNREKWSAYEVAIDEMVARTSTHDAPWTLVSATDKKAARLDRPHDALRPAGGGAVGPGRDRQGRSRT